MMSVYQNCHAMFGNNRAHGTALRLPGEVSLNLCGC